MRRLLALPVLAVLLGSIAAISWSTPAMAKGGPQVTFQISDARAYAYKASISQPVIQAANPFTACMPKQDKYHCTDYNHKKDCPSSVAFGTKKLPPDPQPPANVDGISGGAGDNAGEDPNGTGVPQSSAVRLNRVLTDAALGREGNVLAANGLGALAYTELASPPWGGKSQSGAGDADAYTQTDAFTNQSNYEERCSPEPAKDSVKKDDYAHEYSRSFKTPATDHYAECFQTQCNFGLGDYTGATADHAVTQVHLENTGGTVSGVLSAMLQDVKFPGGFFQVDELQSYVKFESDGTASGLRWQVISSAQGAHFAGQPVNLPTGRSIELGAGDQQMAVGFAGPYVSAPKDGSQLTVVAPGMFVATPQQTAFLGGIEITANFGRGTTPVFPSFPSTTSKGPAPAPASGGTTSGGAVTTGGGGVSFPQPSSGGSAPVSSGSQPVSAAQPQFALISRRDPPWAPIAILALGTLGLLIAFLRWAQQFEWGRRMYEGQPLRSFEWLYRAFLKT
jgi:hypothetical protein